LRVQVSMSYLEFGDLNGILGIQKTELELFTVNCKVNVETRRKRQGAHITFGAWCETASFIIVCTSQGRDSFEMSK